MLQTHLSRCKQLSFFFRRRPTACCLLLTAYCLLFSPPVYANKDTDRSSRLSLLRQATGQESGSSPSSFSNRVDSILNQTQFETARQEADDYADQQNLAPVTAEPIADEMTEISSAKDKTRVDTKAQESTSKELKVKTDEASFLAQQEKDAEEARKRSEEEILPAEETKPEPKQSRFEHEKLSPSLAQNPFYFPEESNKSFQEQKPVIVSRLRQAGYTELEADNLVNSATSSEELILTLMHDEGMEYGDAQDYAST